MNPEAPFILDLALVSVGVALANIFDAWVGFAYMAAVFAARSAMRA